MDVGEAMVAAAVAEGEAFVIDSKLMLYCGMDVVDIEFVFDH